MTDLRQAAQQALEALETYKGFIDDAHIIEGQWHWLDGSDNAITALKAALEQPEQEPVEYQMRLRPTWEVTSWSDWKKCSRESARACAKTPRLHDWEYEVRALYTTTPAAQPEQEPVISAWSLREVYFDEDGEPSMHRSPPAAQRKWVGLTNEEIAEILCDDRWQMRPELMLLACQAKLKEKNT